MEITRTGVLAALFALSIPPTFAQSPEGAPPPPPDAQQQPLPQLSPDQLDNLVAPVALYPDPLLGQVLSASTYPLEVVEANQWLSQNRNLRGQQLMDAARQQNWDASVQALVAFPDALQMLANNVRWTTDLGNAFLAQEPDVMAAVQRMRTRAQANGRLSSTSQQTVTTAVENGQTAIEIVPADPQVIYVPVYSPEYVWGPPVWGWYPPLWYPPGFGFGFFFGPAYSVGAFFPGWGGWGGWGWGCGWFHRSLYVNTVFFGHYGFHGYHGGTYYGGYGHRGPGYYGRMTWAHNPEHRMGIPYSNRTLATRYGGTYGAVNRSAFAGGAGHWNGGRLSQASPAPPNSGWPRVGSSGSRGPVTAPNTGTSSGRVGSPSFRPSMPQNSSPNRGYAAPQANPAQRGLGSPGYSAPRSAPSGSAPARPAPAPSRLYSSPSFSAPRGYSGGSSYSMPRSTPSYSAPRSSGGGSSYSTPRSTPSYSAPRSYGGGSSYSTPRSTPSYSAPRSYGGGSSYSMPRSTPSYSAPRSYGGGSSYSMPRSTPSYSAPRSYGGGGYSAPSRSYSAPRSYGGGGGYSAPRSYGGGGGGGHYSGGGGGGGHHR